MIRLLPPYQLTLLPNGFVRVESLKSGIVSIVKLGEERPVAVSYPAYLLAQRMMKEA